MENRALAELLIRKAHELEGRDDNLFRIRAYRRAAEAVLGVDRPVQDIIAEAGPGALRNLPGIGSRLGRKILNLVQASEFSTLNAEEKHSAII